MVSKAKKVLLLIFALVITSIALTFAALKDSGPVDISPHLYKTAQCSDSSWSTVAIYLKKARRFSADTDTLVKVFDSQGDIVYEEKLQQFDTWEDAANNIRGDAPAGFCNKALFVQQQ